MAKKATAPKKAAKPVAKVAAKKTAAPAKKAPPAKPAAKVTKAAPAKAAAPAKPAKAAAKAVPVSKPALMTKKGSEKASEVSNPKDQGDLLIEKAKEEMANINAAKVAAEKNAKIKPIKIERGNAADEKAKWQELFKRHGKDKAAAYKMTDSFDALKPLQHKVLGWGFVLSNENNRLEVLFENGIKMLISNYKAS
ncbi:MAG: hypothetical protein NDI63_07040 [Pseudobdellovibrio sp.]|nr:hypothetical protein [Pseudobdellovibrio sp.]